MQITIKLVTQQSFKIDMNPRDTVAQLKQAIEKVKGFPVAQQRLIFSGQILTDEQTISQLNIDAKKFIVLMLTTTKTTSTSTKTAQKKPAVSTAKLAESISAKTMSSQSAKPSVIAPSQQTVNPPPPEMVEQMVNMGFEKDKVLAALKVSANNSDLAVQLLVSGAIPDNKKRVPSSQQQQATPVRSQATNKEAPENEDEVDHALEEIRSHPMFPQLQELVRQNPDILDDIVRDFTRSNPSLMQAIQGNEARFLEMLNEHLEDEEREEESHDTDKTPKVSATLQKVTAPSHHAKNNPGSADNQDQAAIQRLISLGFPEEVAREAYFVCDKNEAMAANYLLDRK